LWGEEFRGWKTADGRDFIYPRGIRHQQVAYPEKFFALVSGRFCAGKVASPPGSIGGFSRNGALDSASTSLLKYLSLPNSAPSSPSSSSSLETRKEKEMKK
jgi:hypothetical protein